MYCTELYRYELEREERGEVAVKEFTNIFGQLGDKNWICPNATSIEIEDQLYVTVMPCKYAQNSAYAGNE